MNKNRALEYALKNISKDTTEKILREVLVIDWNYTETALLNYFANYDWKNKGMEKIIERVGTLKKIMFVELPKELSLIK